MNLQAHCETSRATSCRPIGLRRGGVDGGWHAVHAGGSGEDLPALPLPVAQLYECFTACDIAKDAQTALLGLCQELLVAVSKFRSCVLVCWYLCRT